MPAHPSARIISFRNNVSQPDFPEPSGLSVLIVDDDTLVRETTAWMLMDAGHEVYQASDGLAALEFLQVHGPVDLLISDINMPRMDGLTLVQQTHARWPSLPVLLVSGRPQPPGSLPHMAKPFNWSTLMNAVARAVPRNKAV